MPEQNKSLLEAMKHYVESFPNINDIDLHYDRTDSEPVNYSIQTSGLIKISENVWGDSKWQYNGILQSRVYTADDISRLNASQFTEDFIKWISKNNKLRIFPKLPQNCEAESITADNPILLSIDEDGDRGVYQIQIHLTFLQNSEEEI